MSKIDEVIAVAKNEIGYLEKASNSSLYDKTANAGSANYTKYWAEVAPSYQGQPWCACFVTWCFDQVFGSDTTKTLLKHYPYISCSAISKLFTLNANPTVGDIVIFYKSSSGFYHTGIVTAVSGDYFETIEGNTSGGSSVISNGGGVCAKSYYNSNLPGTKFITVDWDSVADVEFTETATSMTGVITASELNVRALPSTSATIIGKHVAGDTVEISAVTDNGWYRVDYPTIGTGYISATYVNAWVTVVEETPSQDDFNALVNTYIADLETQDPSPWSQGARTWAETTGIIQGGSNGEKMYKGYVSREQLAQILYNYYTGVIA